MRLNIIIMFCECIFMKSYVFSHLFNPFVAKTLHLDLTPICSGCHPSKDDIILLQTKSNATICQQNEIDWKSKKPKKIMKVEVRQSGLKKLKP